MFALRYMGDGEFRALHPKLTDRELVVGEVQRWEIVQERSRKSHDHFFVVLHDAWMNLPESLVLGFPNETILRKHCLIKKGYCQVHRFACKTKAEAVAAMKTIRAIDQYAVCEINGTVLTAWIAESQSKPAMGGKRFQQSKSDVLDALSEMLGADVAEAGRAA